MVNSRVIHSVVYRSRDVLRILVWHITLSALRVTPHIPVNWLCHIHTLLLHWLLDTFAAYRRQNTLYLHEEERDISVSKQSCFALACEHRQLAI